MNYNFTSNYQAIVIGASAGGMDALRVILSSMPNDFPVPVIIVQHLSPDKPDHYLAEYLNNRCNLNVKEADEKESIEAGNVYIAPAAYHLLVETDRSFSLSVNDKIRFCRPSIDVLFESAAEAYSTELIGIILTGANSDGAEGLKTIKESGGLTVVQDPETAESNSMPRSAIEACDVDHILPLNEIPGLLLAATMNNQNRLTTVSRGSIRHANPEGGSDEDQI